MTEIDLDELLRLAAASTPGPWRADVLGSEGYAVTAERSIPEHMRSRIHRVVRVARCGHEDWDTDKANAAYIAAVDPATITALVERVREAERLADMSKLDTGDKAVGIHTFIRDTRARAEAAEARVRELEGEWNATNQNAMDAANRYIALRSGIRALADEYAPGSGRINPKGWTWAAEVNHQLRALLDGTGTPNQDKP